MSFCLSAHACALAALSAVAFVGLAGVALADDDAARAIAGKFAQADESEEAAKRAKVLELMAEAKRKADAARAKARGTTEVETTDAPAAEVVDPEGRIAKAQDDARKRTARERADRAGEVSVADKDAPSKSDSKPERSREDAEAAAARRLLIEAEMRAKEKAAREAREREAEALAAKDATADKEAETTPQPAVEKAEKAPAETPSETPSATAEAEQNSSEPAQPAIAETKPAEAAAPSDPGPTEPLRGPDVDTAEAETADDVGTAEQRDAETRALAERLRRAREARKGLGTEPNALRGPEPPANGRIAVDPEVVGLPRPDQNVTILIKLEVGKKGVRRWSKTADPMLCLHEFCFLSRGAKKSSEKLTRRIAFGPGVALGKRGLACRSSPACVFRNIDLGAVEARLQPVDLRFLRHDRRNPALVRPDHSCGLYDGTFSCARTVDGGNWKAWIVPEATAQAVGPDALEAALKAGLKSTTPAHLREVSER